MSEKFSNELWSDPAFHKGREWGRMEGAVTERERIIAMLENNLARIISDAYEWNGVAGDEFREFDGDSFRLKIVALIKGENSE